MRFNPPTTPAICIAAATLVSACASAPVHDTLAFQGYVVEQIEQKGSQRMMPAPMPGGGSILVPVGEPGSYRLMVRGTDGQMREVVSYQKIDNNACVAVFVNANTPQGALVLGPRQATVKPGSGCTKQ
jgi:hypothetical protein